MSKNTFGNFLHRLEFGEIDERVVAVEVTMQVGGKENFGLPENYYTIKLRRGTHGAIIPMALQVEWRNSGLNQVGQNRAMHQILECVSKEVNIADPSGSHENL